MHVSKLYGIRSFFTNTHKRNKLFQVIGDENVHFQNEEEEIIPRAKSTETNYMPIRLYLI